MCLSLLILLSFYILLYIQLLTSLLYLLLTTLLNYMIIREEHVFLLLFFKSHRLNYCIHVLIRYISVFTLCLFHSTWKGADWLQITLLHLVQTRIRLHFDRKEIKTADLHHLDFYQAKVVVKSLLAPHLSWHMDGKRLLRIHSTSLPRRSSVSSLSVIKWETFTSDLLIHQSGTLWDTEVVLIIFWANSCWLA